MLQNSKQNNKKKSNEINKTTQANYLTDMIFEFFGLIFFCRKFNQSCEHFFFFASADNIELAMISGAER